MITLEEINQNLIRTFENTHSTDFIGIAYKDNNNGSSHSGLTITIDQKCYLFHFTGTIIELIELSSSSEYLHSKLNLISDDQVKAFFAHCKIICEKARPSFGFFYSGSYYVNGEYFSSLSEKQFMTCVGFCINVVLGFIEHDEYFNYADWSVLEGNNNVDDYFNQFIKDNDILKDKIELFRKNLRRIKPSEYLSSSFIENIPIRKNKIDEIINLVNDVIIDKLQLTRPIGI